MYTEDFYCFQSLLTCGNGTVADPYCKMLTCKLEVPITGTIPIKLLFVLMGGDVVHLGGGGGASG